MTTVRRNLILAMSCAVAALGLAACGSSSSSKTSSSSTPAAAASATKTFAYGYSLPTGQNPWINAIATTVRSTAGPSGGQMTMTDAQLNPGKAVEQVNGFISQGVKSITVAPAQVPQSLIAPFAKAVSNRINVFGLEWSFARNPTAPPTPPVQGQVNIDRGKLGRDVATAVNQGALGAAKIIYVGLPFPVASLDFFEASMRGALGTSRIVAKVVNPTDNAQGALGPLTGALAAHPEANAIVTYNGPSALAAVQALKSAGRQGKVKIYNIQLDTATAAALKAGSIAAAWDLNPLALGRALGAMIAEAGAGKPKSDWAKTVVVVAPQYTKANIDTWKDWSVGG